MNRILDRVNPDNKSFKISLDSSGRWCVYEWTDYTYLENHWSIRKMFYRRYQARRYVRKILKSLATKPEYY